MPFPVSLIIAGPIYSQGFEESGLSCHLFLKNHIYIYPSGVASQGLWVDFDMD